MRLLSRAHLLSRPLKPHHHHLSQLRRPFAISSTAHGMRQPPNSDTVNFPGAVQSKFTSDLKFHKPQDATAMPTYRYIDADGVVVDKSRTIEIGQEKALKIYKDMVTTSVMDLIMYESQRQGRISFYMNSDGEEGIAVGSAAALEDEDVIYAQYREQGALMYRGYTLDEFMNQLFGTKHDYGKGRNMPIHYMSERLHWHPISSPLATQIPHAVGAAYALKLENSANIVVCYFGEGAASEGDFHAGLNIAATKKCPVVFVCRNNGYAISTPTLEQYAGDGIASRGVGYGIETVRVDGNDVLAVYETMREARRIAVEHQKPVLVEAMSYRVSHHSTSDDSFAYRAKMVVEEWKRRDHPITRFRKYLETRNWWSADEDTAFRIHVRKDVLAALARAQKEMKPSVKEIFSDVFVEPTPELQEQRELLRDVLERYPNEYDLVEFEGGKDGA